MFNPLEQQGIPLDEQIRNWREMDVIPIDPDDADPYTRCRIIAMNGIETEAVFFDHHFIRHCPDPEVRRQISYLGYIEAQQQRVVNWLLPGIPSALETAIAYEQVAVDLTAWVARMEPDRTCGRRTSSGSWRTSTTCTGTPTCSSWWSGARPRRWSTNSPK